MREVKFLPKLCPKCLQEFNPTQWNQIYCGSKVKKTGCSYEREQERLSLRSKTEEYRAYQSAYQKKWRKDQREVNSPYAQRQKDLKRKYYQTEKGKLSQENWRRSHPDAIRMHNRRRKLIKSGVFGSHTQEEWEYKKKKFNFTCAICGINEASLAEKYPDTQFYKLTRDHILPISKGGSDLIDNIQPACVSCNSKKRDSVGFIQPGAIISLEDFAIYRDQLGKIVCTSCPADPLHPGHLSCLLESATYGDTLVVIVNGDWFLENKKGAAFMPVEMRCQILSAVRGVDIVVPFIIEGDTTVCKALEIIRPHVFTKGGDRVDPNTIPEWKVCEMLGAEIVTGVGDPKVNSSSDILRRWGSLYKAGKVS